MANAKVPVGIQRCESYEHGSVVAALRKVLESIGGLENLKQRYGRRVLLKPNMLTGAAPERAATTHPAVVAALLELLNEHGFEIFVGDSPAVDSSTSAAKKCGISEVAEKYGAKMVDFSETVEVANLGGKLVHKFTVAKITQEVDFVITVAKLKTHGQMYYTGAIKNLFGVIAGLHKSQFHFRFPERERFAAMIVDLCALIKPRLAIMDAVVGMEGIGPMSGTPKPLGFLAASSDALALDWVCADIIGYRPSDIPILQQALLRGEWISSPDQIEVVGVLANDVRPASFAKVSITKNISFLAGYVPAFVERFVRDLTVQKPRFNTKKCILCAKCVQICPPKALWIEDSQDGRGKRVCIDDEKCIRCYCCHEVCAPEAIDLKRTIFKQR
jgi:uncharacterized protein (DUF362 family)/Pyruvate/2-oxoacid:ferredoxin oxidoreductase delta subunit